MRTLKRKYITAVATSATLDAVLGYIYRKKHLLGKCGRYADRVIDGLVELGLVTKVKSSDNTFYFKTDKAKDFRAIDFAKEFLWNYHNPANRQSNMNGQRLIYCFDKNIPNGEGLIEVETAIKKCYV